jgi:hypothetical protein
MSATEVLGPSFSTEQGAGPANSTEVPCLASPAYRV